MINNKKANRLPPVSDGAATTGATTSPPPVEDRIDCSIIPLTNRNKKSRYDDGLDWLRQPSNDLPAGAVSLSLDVGIPNSAGGGFTTMLGDELYRNTQRDIQERRMLDDRFGFGNDPYSQPSGLSVRGRSHSDDNNSDSSSNSSGLSV